MILWSRDSARGAALTVAIIVIIIVSLLAVYAFSAGFNQSLLAGRVGGVSQIQRYWTARSGVIDATERIRRNVVALNPTGSLGGGRGNNFTNASWDPPPYYLNLDNDQTNTGSRPSGPHVALVDIGPVNTADSSYPRGVRKIESTAV